MENLKKKIRSERSRRIGLLGLAANPPHNWHLQVAKLILRKKLVDAVWLVPCYSHPFNKPLAPFKHRYAMALLMGNKEIQATNVEFRLKGRSYTIETVKALQKEYPCCDFFWIVGSDIVKSGSYKKWKEWGEISSLVDFLAVSRPGFKIKKIPSGFIAVKGKMSNISSTEIRERIRQGLPIDGLVPLKIKEYIEKHNLYK